MITAPLKATTSRPRTAFAAAAPFAAAGRHRACRAPLFHSHGRVKSRAELNHFLLRSDLANQRIQKLRSTFTGDGHT